MRATSAIYDHRIHRFYIESLGVHRCVNDHKLPSGNWRAQVRRNGSHASNIVER